MKLECLDCGTYSHQRGEDPRCVCGSTNLVPSKHTPREKPAPAPAPASKCSRCGRREMDGRRRKCSACGGRLFKRRRKRAA